MLCPMCNVDLLLAERQGIEIDYCPKCRGIWLDRGELDKLVERSSSQTTQKEEYREPPANYSQPVHHEGRHRPQEHYRRKRKSFLEDIFDFD